MIGFDKNTVYRQLIDGTASGVVDNTPVYLDLNGVRLVGLLIFVSISATCSTDNYSEYFCLDLENRVSLVRVNAITDKVGAVQTIRSKEGLWDTSNGDLSMLVTSIAKTAVGKGIPISEVINKINLLNVYTTIERFDRKALIESIAKNPDDEFIELLLKV